MYSKELEEIIDAALADGVLTDKERAVLIKRAVAEGVDPDEFEVVIEGRLAKMKKTEDWLRPAPPKPFANEKLGNVVKCPSCGAPVVGGSAVCAECGHTFSNVEANSTYLNLSKKLEEIDISYRKKSSFNLFASERKASEQASAIRMCPIPNTRNDLLEFLAAMNAAAKSLSGFDAGTEDRTLAKAYKAKYEECVNKARISFANDPDFAPYLQEKEKKGFFGRLFGKK